ncbi:hypothetical protein [Microbacterium sp. LWO12-1.2]|uniref:hypothetical protein n=1 Tax=Microbacterium sp. LWO12-1.2 TaxID=3135261 RepID=UPI00342E8BAF
MFDSKARRSLVVMPAVFALFALSACSAPAGDDKADDAANDAAAARFVTCLTEEGQTAKIVEGGQVGLLMPEVGGDGGMGTLSDSSVSVSVGEGEGEEMAMSMIFSDDDGTWLASTAASGYPEDGGQRAAWEKCEEEVPEFTQPEPDISMQEGTQMFSPEEFMQSGLDFAACARENGFTDFADPDADAMLELPAGITEDEARTLLDACADTAGDMPPMFTQASIEAVDFDWFAVMAEYFDGAFSAATVLPSGGDE